MAPVIGNPPENSIFYQFSQAYSVGDMGSETGTRLTVSGVEFCAKNETGPVEAIRLEVTTIDLKKYSVIEKKLLPVVGQIPFPVGDSCKYMNVSFLDGENFESATFANNSKQITFA